MTSKEIIDKIKEVFKGEYKVVKIKMLPSKEVYEFIQKVEKAHRDAAKSNLRFGSAYPEDRLNKLLTEAYGKLDSSTPLDLRKCNDLKNFLEKKAMEEAESLKTKMYFEQTPIYA